MNRQCIEQDDLESKGKPGEGSLVITIRLCLGVRIMRRIGIIIEIKY